MSENSPDDVDQTDGSATFLRQVFELWLNPEIERRKSAGAQCVPFALHRAQVIMNVGAPNVVRLNDEVRAGFFAKPRGDLSTLKVGEPIDWDAIETIEEVRLTDHDADAAHVTLLLVGGRWLLTFDFRYNSSRARKLCDAAEQFFEAAVNARAKNHDRAFMKICSLPPNSRRRPSSLWNLTSGYLRPGITSSSQQR